MVTVGKKLAETFRDIGVRYVFGVPSGNWVDFLDGIQRTEGVEFILVTNEASAGFMADTCWRLTGNIAACFGTYGPGACNLSTGVCGGYLDRSPMIVLCDEMEDSMLKRISQMNIDQQTLFKPITKWQTRLSATSIKKTVFKAYQKAIEGIPGPVYIGLPTGVGGEQAHLENIILPASKEIKTPNDRVLEKMVETFQKAKRPLLALGLGSNQQNLVSLIQQFVEKHEIPVVLTPMAKGIFPEDNQYYVGVLAHALSDIVAKTFLKADLIISIGYDPVEINYKIGCLQYLC